MSAPVHEWVDAVLSAVLLASRDAGVLALAIGGILLVCGRKISPAWRHGLWLLVVVRLLLPALPGGALSWQRLLPAPAPPVVVAEPTAPPARPADNPPPPPLAGAVDEAALPMPVPVASKASAAPTATPSDETLLASASDPVAFDFDWKGALPFVWLAGVGGYLLLVSVLVLRFRRRVRTLRVDDAVEATAAGELLERVAREQGCRRVPALRITRAVPAPAVSGLLRTEILLPPSTLQRLDETELRLVLLHELAHLRRRDLWLHWLLTLLQAVHWFNPVLWWAFHRLRVEAEGAADAWALQRCGDETPLRYGEALLRLLETETPPQRVAIPGVVGVVESARDLRSRIRAIGRFSRRRSRLATAGAAALVVGLAAVGLTQAPKEAADKAEVPEATHGESPLPEEIDSPVTRVSEVENEEKSADQPAPQDQAAASAEQAPADTGKLVFTCLVRDEAGNPVSGAEVFFQPDLQPVRFGRYPTEVFTATTDGEGKAVISVGPFESLPDRLSGEWYARHETKGMAAIGSKQVMIPAEPVELVLSEGTAMPLKAVDENGDPISGLALRVVSLRERNAYFWCHPSTELKGFWSATTDANGECVIHGFPEDKQLEVYVDHADERYAQPEGRHHSKFQLKVGHTEPQILRLESPSTISGRVVFPDGSPAAGVRVRALEQYHYTRGGCSEETTTDADGRYALKRLLASEYDIGVTLPEALRRDWAQPVHAGVSLDKGRPFEMEDIVLTPGALVTGRVTLHDTGAGVPDLLIGGTGPPSKTSPLVLWWTQTDAEGNYHFRLQPGDRRVYLGGPPPEGYRKPEDNERDLTLEEGDRQVSDFVLEGSAVLTGRVLDEDGEPVAGATVQLRNAGFPGLKWLSEEDGAFRIDTGIIPGRMPGEWTVFAFWGDLFSTDFVTAVPGTPVEVRLRKKGLGRAEGRVVDETGNPIAGATVRWHGGMDDNGYLAWPETTTDDEGRFVAERVVPDERIGFSATAEGYGSSSHQLGIKGGETATVPDFILGKAGKVIAGRVVDAKGEPVRNANVLTEDNRQPEIRRLTDAEGRFRLEGIVMGWIWMKAAKADRQTRVRVRAGAEGVVVRLPENPNPWKPEEIIDFTGKPAPPLRVDHWYHAENPDPEHKGKIRMIRFVGKERPLIHFSGTVELMQKNQDEFAGKGVEFLLVHGPWPKEEVEEILASDHPNLTVPLAIESEEGAMSDAFGVRHWLTVVIDREGKVVLQNKNGKGSKAAVQKLLDAEKEEKPAAQPAPQNQAAAPAAPAPADTGKLAFTCLVRDEAGNPVSGAEVFFQPDLQSMRFGRYPAEVLTATTDGEGTAVLSLGPFESLPKQLGGEWFARHGTKGIAASGYRSVLPPNPMELVLREGADMPLKVVDEAGLPIAGLELRAVELIEVDLLELEAYFHCLPGEALKDFWSATTDAKGECVIRGLPEGKKVHVDHSDERYAQPERWLDLNLRLESGNTEAHLIRLEPAATISGRVAFPDGSPAVGVTVKASTQRLYARGECRDETTTDTDGRYVLKRLLASDYDIGVTFPEALQEDWAQAVHSGISLEKGWHVEAPDTVLTPGALVTGRVILPDTGEGVPDFTIGGTSPSHTSHLLQWWTTTDAEGNYRFRLSPGERTVYLAGGAPEGYSRPKGNERTLTLRESDRQVVDFTLAGSSVLTGRVLDEDGGPVVGATVRFHLPLRPGLKWLSGEDGSFLIDLRDELDGVKLFAYRDDWVSTQPVIAAPGKPVEIRLGKSGPGRAEGRVIDEEGNPIAGATVTWYGALDSKGHMSGEASTDDEGRFVAERVIPDEGVGFSASAAGYREATQHLDIEGGKTATVPDLILSDLAKAGKPIAGRVVDAKGEPVRDADVWTEDERQPEARQLSDEEGRFRFEGIVMGWIWVKAAKTGKQTRVRVRAGTENVVVHLPEEANPSQPEEIVDFTGKPAPPLRVERWLHAESPDPEHKGKIRMIQFVGKDRSLIYFFDTVRLMKELQDEFAGQGVEFLLVHGPWPKEEVEEILATDHPNRTVPLAIESEEGAMSDAFGVRHWLTVVTDREGKVVYQDRNGNESKAAVQKLLDAEKE